MQHSEHYELKLPETTDNYTVDNENANTTAIDTALYGLETGKEAALSAAAAKAAPADGDSVVITDSAEGGKTKRVLWSGIKTALGSVFAAASHSHATGDITTGTLGVPRGGTGLATLTSGYFLRGNGTDAVTLSTPAAAKTAMAAATALTPVTCSFTVAGWTLNSTTSCYEQTVACAGLLTTDDKRTSVTPVGSTDAAAQKLTDAAEALVTRYSCGTDGYLSARAASTKPTVAFSVAVSIIRG